MACVRARGGVRAEKGESPEPKGTRCCRIDGRKNEEGLQAKFRVPRLCVGIFGRAGENELPFGRQPCGVVSYDADRATVDQSSDEAKWMYCISATGGASIYCRACNGRCSDRDGAQLEQGEFTGRSPPVLERQDESADRRGGNIATRQTCAC